MQKFYYAKSNDAYVMITEERMKEVDSLKKEIEAITETMGDAIYAFEVNASDLDKLNNCYNRIEEIVLEADPTVDPEEIVF